MPLPANVSPFRSRRTVAAANTSERQPCIKDDPQEASLSVFAPVQVLPQTPVQRISGCGRMYRLRPTVCVCDMTATQLQRWRRAHAKGAVLCRPRASPTPKRLLRAKAARCGRVRGAHAIYHARARARSVAELLMLMPMLCRPKLPRARPGVSSASGARSTLKRAHERPMRSGDGGGGSSALCPAERGPLTWQRCAQGGCAQRARSKRARGLDASPVPSNAASPD
ncbi:MAG: hypothetical protein J3K34DRAFT_434208 [Monoraphidium minutum]|nr:MAG: hypothetical protein J3K34DRAFT_434208 [Monoraphidium minutum]